MAEPSRALLLSFGFALLLITPGISMADREANPGEVLLISDEIFGHSVNVTRPSSGGGVDDPGGNSNNRSGLGDGTNLGQGSGKYNSPNEGTDNPNQSGAGSDAHAGRGNRRGLP